MSKTVKRPERPYLGKRELDDVMLMTTQLLTELWIVKDRLAVVEKLLQEKQLLDRAHVDDFVPAGEFANELTRERDALVRRVVGAPFNVDSDVDSLRSERDIG
jgi:hypothetical protein